ncbi:hypothetical protein DFQ30_000994 [Apophysomyces sp. BC1015]|nr:hypothetical protein DFQ30_000994 [Apophysomyces sp. BC1015]KAG0180620.1 hypothetical protein DFQ29_000330 [Apophysomyces sp. BC1021]
MMRQAAIRHFSFNNIQLSLPNTYTTTLDECLRQFTAMEHLQDASCRKCSLIYTMQTISSKLGTLKDQMKHAKSTKKKNAYLTKMVNLEKTRREIEYRLRVGRIEEELDDSLKGHIPRTVSRLSTKQVMLAKPPRILCLHLSRSAFHTSGALYKNTCQLTFPEYLDIAPYCTNGTLHTQPNIPISTFHQDDSYGRYKLMSAVVHYGSHSYGHFVTYKRRIVANHCSCTKCPETSGEVWEGEDVFYRISDTKVDICSLDTVLLANPYMLLYEWVEGDTPVKEEMTHQGMTTESPTTTDALETLHEKENHLTPVYYDDTSLEALKVANSLLMYDQQQGQSSIQGESTLELPAVQGAPDDEDMTLFDKRQSGRRKRKFVGAKTSGRNSWEKDNLVSVRE